MKHCYHPDGHQYLSYPPQWKSICCWCGKPFVFTSRLTIPKNHGPNAPNEIEVADDDEECPKRPESVT